MCRLIFQVSECQWDRNIRDCKNANKMIIPLKLIMTELPEIKENIQANISWELFSFSKIFIHKIKTYVWITLGQFLYLLRTEGIHHGKLLRSIEGRKWKSPGFDVVISVTTPHSPSL